MPYYQPLRTPQRLSITPEQSNNKRINITVSEEFCDILTNAAIGANMSRSAFVRAAVLAYIDAMQSPSEGTPA